MRSKEQKLYDAGLDAQTGGRFTVAAEKYRSCLKIVPNSIPVLNNYGYCLMALHKYGAALKVLEKADKIQPDNVTILGNLATCYRQVGDLEPRPPGGRRQPIRGDLFPLSRAERRQDRDRHRWRRRGLTAERGP